jgi:5-methylthioribose kinase
MLDLLEGNASAIEARLRELRWIDPNETLQGLSSAGEGNMNRTLRADLGGRTMVLKQSVPFVAKYPAIAAPADRIAVEAAFYRATAQPAALAQRLPAVYGFDAANRLLALEDLGAAADFTEIYRSDGDARRTDIDGRHTAALLDWLGMLHGQHVGAADRPILENRAMRALNHAHIFDIPLRADNGVDLDAMTPGLAALARRYHDDAPLRQHVTALGAIYLGDAPHASTAALLHGDYYPGSWLRHPRLDVAIIDPEFGFIGPPEFDVGVLIAHFTFARIGQTDLMTALRNYAAPAGFSLPLALAFAGAEVIRRLLGVAQLPLVADLATKATWLAAARQFVVAL